MSLGDHKFTLSNQCLQAMAETFWHTRVKERGNMLCDGDEIMAGPEHIGGASSITTRDCHTLSRAHIGHFHTHPGSASSVPSWWDALNILQNSVKMQKPWLGCRAGKGDQMVRCDTVAHLPSLLEVSELMLKRRRKRFSYAPDDPEIWRHFTTPYSFPVASIPDLIKAPPTPAPPPNIKEETFVFAKSAFVKYTNLDTGETRIQSLY
jgi:hypothetical protein